MIQCRWIHTIKYYTFIMILQGFWLFFFFKFFVLGTKWVVKFMPFEWNEYVIHELWTCNEMAFFFFWYWVCKCYGYVIKQNVVYFYKYFFFFFFCIGYEMGNLSMTEKEFGYEMCNKCVMKFMPFEWIGICTLCSLTR